MLRYKNSLLERILLEKGISKTPLLNSHPITDTPLGIDVQAELRAKTSSPNLGPTHIPQNLVQHPPIQRAILNRHHARRSNSSIAPKLEPGIVSPLPPPLHPHPSAASPKSRPTPSSHSTSPTATTSYGSQHGASPASSDHLSASIRPPLPPMTAMKAPPPPHGLPSLTGQRHLQMAALQQGQNHARGNVPGGAAPYYPAPSFQNHIEQLGKLTRFLFPFLSFVFIELCPS